MEKTLNLVHNNYSMVSPERREIDLKDYDERDFLISAGTASPAMSIFMSNRYSEYRKLRFPHWKRVDLRKMVLPEITFRKEEDYRDFHAKPLSSLSDEETELLNRMDFEGSDRKLVLLGDVFFDTGHIFSIPDNSFCEKPLVIDEQLPGGRIYSNLFVVGQGAHLRIVFDKTNSGRWFLQNNRFLLGKKATVEILFINNLPISGYGFVNNLYHLEEKSALKVYEASTGGSALVTYHLGIADGKKADMSFEPVFLADGNSRIDLQYITRIKSAESIGNINGTGVVMDESYAIFRGTVDMKTGAKNSTGNEHSSVMLLSDRARTDSIPCLLVNENEVNASHAATIGSLDEEKVFYLMSRGMTRNQALRLIIKGTFEPVFEKTDRIFPEYSGGLRNVFSKRFE